MNEQLLLENIRGVLIRLEDTIIFSLLERAQFRQNAVVYARGAMQGIPAGDSLMGYVLHETEKVHARIRRYTSPDEAPFYDDLPEPVLPPLNYSDCPIHPNQVNLTSGLREVYEERIVPHICDEGDDGQYGSSCVCDCACLQDMARRIHTGKFVAESKLRADPDRFLPLVRGRNVQGLMTAITDTTVEARVLQRVFRKAGAYVSDLAGESLRPKLSPERVADVFSRWLIPMTKHVEVQYLLERGDGLE
jgi:chorismate mutase